MPVLREIVQQGLVSFPEWWDFALTPWTWLKATWGLSWGRALTFSHTLRPSFVRVGDRCARNLKSRTQSFASARFKSGAKFPLSTPLTPFFSFPTATSPSRIALVKLPRNMASKSQGTTGTTAEHQCARKSCTNPAPQICTGCKTARYCSKHCQKVHWIASHKTECRSPKSPEADRHNY